MWPAFALDHCRQHGAHQAEHAVDVDRQQLVPGIRIAVGDVARNVEAGVRQQEIDLPEVLAMASATTRSTSAGLRQVRRRLAARRCRYPLPPSRDVPPSARPARPSTPSAASAFAIARPMPELAPVTSATLPDSNHLSHSFLLHCVAAASERTRLVSDRPPPTERYNPCTHCIRAARSSAPKASDPITTVSAPAARSSGTVFSRMPPSAASTIRRPNSAT